MDIPESFDWPLTLTVEDASMGKVELQRINAGTSIHAINDDGLVVAESLASYANFDLGLSEDRSRIYLGTPQPKITRVLRLENGQVRIYFDAPPTSNHTILQSINLVDWTPLGSARETVPGHFEFIEEAGGRPLGFYRVQTP